MECPVCGFRMLKHKSNFNKGYWWACTRYPKCTCTIQEDMLGRSITNTADKETRQLRRKAHQVAESIWGSWEKGDKNSMYHWLQDNSKTGHIRDMEKDELITVINKLTILAIKK